jgi:hypothetical protein
MAKSPHTGHSKTRLCPSLEPERATNSVPPYAGVRDVFTVRCLPNAPNTFVIVADDDSRWAQRLRCDARSQVVSDPANKMNFVPDNASYRDACPRAVGAAGQAHCVVD